jgi:hypothetical protein
MLHVEHCEGTLYIKPIVHVADDALGLLCVNLCVAVCLCVCVDIVGAEGAGMLQCSGI